MTTSGYGATAWGGGPWGVGTAPPLQLVAATAIRENVVRLTFNTAVKFTKIFDPGDAFNPDSYAVTLVEGSLVDGGDPRNVDPIIAELFGSRQVDLIVDRPFSGWPAQYTITIADLKAASGASLDTTATTLTFTGLFRRIENVQPDDLGPSRDIGNPQTLSGLQDLSSFARTTDETLLGTIPADETGDYAYDKGVEGLKKRILRRVISGNATFAHLGKTYGFGLLRELKRLGRSATLDTIAGRARTQVQLEPEVRDSSVQLSRDPRAAGLYRLQIKVVPKTLQSFTIDETFSPTEE